jgi:hypothetical protein
LRERERRGEGGGGDEGKHGTPWSFEVRNKYVTATGTSLLHPPIFDLTDPKVPKDGRTKTGRVSNFYVTSTGTSLGIDGLDAECATSLLWRKKG